MRPVVQEAAVPDGAIRLIGVASGEPLEALDIGEQTLASLEFEGQPNETLLVAGPSGRAMLVGLGDDPDAETIRKAAGSAGRAIAVHEDIATSLPLMDVPGVFEAAIGGLLAGSYRFTDYRSSDDQEPGRLVVLGDVDRSQLERALVTSEAVYIARDWVNRPPQDKAPEVLAVEMRERLSGTGFHVEVWDEQRIREERMGGLIAVAAGSDRPPRMLVARRSAPGAPRLALVGKGIVFDSGGLSIKPTEGMTTMKGDMAGGATVVAAAEAIGRLGVEADVRVYVPLTDNMAGGSAMKPGDVLTIRNGKTIEVLNTDAEGRLVLADALSLAAEEEPDLMVDVATLTGASRVALGDEIGAVFSSSADDRDLMLAAAEAAGERMWSLPLPADHRRMIDSAVADMKNTGGRYGGAIAAALLLAEFTSEQPWIHLDVAGPSFFREDHALGPKGGSGFGVATLVTLAGMLAAADQEPGH